MSINYYILTRDKSIIERYGLEYSLTDEPDWGYWVHIVQLCGNYVPLFQAHRNVRSLPTVFCLLQEPNVKVYDEYCKKIDATKLCNELQARCNDPTYRPWDWNTSTPIDNYIKHFRDAYNNEFLEGDFS